MFVFYVSYHFYIWRDFPSSPVVNTLGSMQGAWVPALVGELRSHMPPGIAKKLKKKKKNAHYKGQRIK